MPTRISRMIGWAMCVGAAVAMLTGILSTEIGIAVGAIGMLTLAQQTTQNEATDEGQSA